MPKYKPKMKKFSMETSVSSRVPRWPAKVWVMVPSEYWQRKVKMAGPARYQSFLDSTMNSLKKSRTSAIGGMSSLLATKGEAKEGFDRRMKCKFGGWSSSLGERSGCLE
ncbi:Uncharacterized protein Adt_01637 [Abeliophyllum distichum]|uniref:Uncharacterized protein n=1 Tax=Abeliophyllum distichum TaxID=126358 RepID=A0ABD1VTE0_9LAMI